MRLILRMREKGGVPMAMRRCSYTAAFKLKLVEYAEKHGNRFARSPRASCRSVANGRVIWSNHTNPCMTGLNYGCDLHSVRLILRKIRYRVFGHRVCCRKMRD